MTTEQGGRQEKNAQFVAGQSEPEIIVASELDITPESILKENQSPLAEKRNNEFSQAKRKGELAFRKGCIDARRTRLNSTKTMEYETIAAGGDPKITERAINSPGIGFVNIESHHGPEKPGESPGECAGRDAKSREMKNGTKNTDGEGLGAFVSNEIKHSDVILQAAITGAKTLRLTNKPVVVSAQNHRTGELKVVSVSQIIKSVLRDQTAIVNQEALYEGQYDPKELYANGVPFIPLDEIEDDKVRQYFEECAVELKALKEADPNFEKKHVLHNPDMMAMLTDLRSTRIILPEISSHPGSIVRLTIPRSEKLDDKAHVKFELEDLKKAWGQAEYVITHATENHGFPNKPFSKLKTIFCATSSYDQAKDLMLDLLSRQFMLPWAKLPDRRIIIAETGAGRIQSIGQLFYDYSDNKLNNIRDVVQWKKA